MSVQRFIYPSIWRCPALASLAPDAQLLFIGCFSTADDEGRRPADPCLLKADVFPLRGDIGPDSVRDLLRTCAEAGLVRVYGQGQWLDLPSWHKYQKPKYRKPSRIPPFSPEPGPNQPGTRAEPAPDPGETRSMGLGLGLGLGSELSAPGAQPPEVKTAPKRDKKRSTEANSPTHRFLLRFDEEFSRRTGETAPPRDWAKDGAIAKRLLAVYPEEKLAALVAAMWDSDDEFVRGAGKTVGLFSKVIPKLLSCRRPGPALADGQRLIRMDGEALVAEGGQYRAPDGQWRQLPDFGWEEVENGVG